MPATLLFYRIYNKMKYNFLIIVSQVKKAGEGRATRPGIGSVVTLKTKTVLLDETEVDVDDNFKFVLGDGDVLQGKFSQKSNRYEPQL